MKIGDARVHQVVDYIWRPFLIGVGGFCFVERIWLFRVIGATVL